MTYPLQNWRLLITASAPGAWNMSIDEAILEAVGADKVQPTLRLYAWNPPCISIGYAQSSKEINFDRLHTLGWDCVRRPTGGRSILHTDELTYSVCAPLSNPRVIGGVLESYQRLSVALLAALHYLNIPAESLLSKNSLPQENITVCFEVPSNYEIVVNGKKLIGSAQVRRKNTLLQHGSFPLFGDLTRVTQALSFPNEQDRIDASTRLLSHATTAQKALGSSITWQDAAQAFIYGFQTELNLELIISELSEEEISRAKYLMQQKYCHPSWLDRL